MYDIKKNIIPGNIHAGEASLHVFLPSFFYLLEDLGTVSSGSFSMILLIKHLIRGDAAVHSRNAR